MKKELAKRSYRPLSKYEQNVLLPILIKGLKMKQGKSNVVTKRQIVKTLRKHGVKISTSSFNSLINYIRVNDLIVGLMASRFGFYISTCEHDLMEYENRLLRREATLRKVRMSIKRQRIALLLQKNEEPLKKAKQLF